MYFTRNTETALTVIATCAGKIGNSLTLLEIAEPGSRDTQDIAACISLLLRHGVLKGRLGARVTLAIDPVTTTLGAILRITQPELALPVPHNVHHLDKNVFTLAMEAASSNFLSIADKFTVADFMGNNPSRGCSATRSSCRPDYRVVSSAQPNALMR